jgi:hypothetical protein
MIGRAQPIHAGGKKNPPKTKPPNSKRLSKYLPTLVICERLPRHRVSSVMGLLYAKLFTNASKMQNAK